MISIYIYVCVCVFMEIYVPIRKHTEENSGLPQKVIVPVQQQAWCWHGIG